MLIELLDPETRNPLFIQHTIIRAVLANPQNPMVTLLVTNVMTPKGPEMYSTLEGIKTVAEKINAAYRGEQTGVVSSAILS